MLKSFKTRRFLKLVVPFMLALTLVMVLHLHQPLLRKPNTKLFNSRRNIFVLDTSKKADFFIDLQWCSLESIAKQNSDADVNVLAFFHKFDGGAEADEIWKILEEAYHNIKRITILDNPRLSLQGLMEGTPLEKLMENNGLENTSYPENDWSDFFRVLILYRFGGLYMDLDYITMRPIPEMFSRNEFAVFASDIIIANSFLNFPQQRSCFLQYHLEQMVSKFKKDSPWGSNGPKAITKSVSSACKNRGGFDLRLDVNWCEVDEEVLAAGSQNKSCREASSGSFGILNKKFANHILYFNWEQFLDPQRISIVGDLENQKSFAVHMYNRMSRGRFQIQKNLEQHNKRPIPFMQIFAKNCPLFYEFRSMQGKS